ncbi:MAG TPA: PsiF family protein [Nitrospiraceae bacterium]|nr:PsiF family protein [Nitrospiraceae bacterium]
MHKFFTVLAIHILVSFVSVPQFVQAETAQQNKMKECNTQAGDMKGDERKAFMKTCLSAKPVKEGGSQQEKMKSCNKEASAKNLKGDERKKFMSSCLSGN